MSERHPSILATSVLVTLATMGVALVSFVNQLLIARLFGESKEMTAYGIAMGGPTLISGVLSAALTFGMVPLLVRHRLEDPEPARFLGTVLVRMAFASGVIALTGALLSDPLVDFLGGGQLDRSTLALAHTVGHVAWANVGLLVLLAHLSAVHDAAHRFLITVLGGAGPYVGMIAGCAVAGRSLGVLAIAYGMLTGNLGGIAFLIARSWRETSFAPPTSEQRASLAAFLRQAPLAIASVLIFTSFQFVDAYWAPRVDEHSLPTLGYAQRLLIAFGALVTSGPLAVITPRLAAALSEGREADFRGDAVRALRLVLGFGGFVAIAVSVLAAPIVMLLFQRGEFDREATARLAAVLPWMMTGMVPMLAVSLLFRAFYAKNWLGSTVVLSLGTVGGYFALSGLLSRSFGAPGIAAGYAAVWTGALVAAVPMLWRAHTAEIVERAQGKYLLALAASLGGTLVLMLGLARLFLTGYEEIGRLAVAVRLAFCGGAGLVTFYALSVRLFQLEEMTVVFGFFWRLTRRLVRSPAQEPA